MAVWHDVVDADELWEDEMSCHDVGGRKILLVNCGGSIRAYDAECPHQMTSLEEDDFDPEDRVIVCHSHQWEFDAVTGEGVNPTGEALTCYELEVKDGRIRVRV